MEMGGTLTILTAAVYTPVGPAAAVSKIGRAIVCQCVCVCFFFKKNDHLEMEGVDLRSNFLTAHVSTGLFNLGLKGRISIFLYLTCCPNRTCRSIYKYSSRPECRT
jgi:hypothetical protein